MTMQSPPQQYTSPFVQFKLAKPSKSSVSSNMPPRRIEKQSTNNSPRSYNTHSQHVLVNGQFPLSNSMQDMSVALPPQQGVVKKKKSKMSQRTASPPLSSSNMSTASQPAYIHWKLNESFDNIPNNVNNYSNNMVTNQSNTSSKKKSKKVKYGCLAFSLSDCTLVNNVNYQKPHHNSSIPSSNGQNSGTLSYNPIGQQHVDSRESISQLNKPQLHAIQNNSSVRSEENNDKYENGNPMKILNIHSISFDNTNTFNEVKGSPSTPVSLSPSQSPRIIRTNISIKDILN